MFLRLHTSCNRAYTELSGEKINKSDFLDSWIFTFGKIRNRLWSCLGITGDLPTARISRIPSLDWCHYDLVLDNQKIIGAHLSQIVSKMYISMCDSVGTWCIFRTNAFGWSKMSHLPSCLYRTWHLNQFKLCLLFMWSLYKTSFWKLLSISESCNLRFFMSKSFSSAFSPALRASSCISLFYLKVIFGGSCLCQLLL